MELVNRIRGRAARFTLMVALAKYSRPWVGRV